MEAAPLAPAIKANTGVMQHSDAAIAATIPVPKSPLDDLNKDMPGWKGDDCQ